MLYRTARRPLFTLLLIASVLNATVRPALAEPVIKLQKWSGQIDLLDDPSPFSLQGTASHLGRFDAVGEVEFTPTAQGGFDGSGVVVFTAANGDQLVGLVTWDVAPGGDVRTSALEFAWRDDVTFSDGHIFHSTGRFADASGRPRGLVVIAIIAILIGLLVPAVQK